MNLRAFKSDGSWCLLLNDLEKHVSEFMDVLNLFDRFPRWRMADVQAVYLVTVVVLEHILISSTCFLFKGLAISDSQFQTVQSTFLTNDEAFFPEAEVRVLKNFQPQSCSLLQAGRHPLPSSRKLLTMVWLRGCKTICTTFSVGFLAPALMSWCFPTLKLL